MAKRINPKVTAAAAATAAVSLTVGLVEWLAVVDVPATVEVPAVVLATFFAGYFKSEGGKHARE